MIVQVRRERSYDEKRKIGRTDGRTSTISGLGREGKKLQQETKDKRPKTGEAKEARGKVDQIETPRRRR